MKKYSMLGMISLAFIVVFFCTRINAYAMVETYKASDFADVKSESIADEKVYHYRESCDEEIILGRVIVVIKKEYSGLNKPYTVLHFPGVAIDEIEYLTPLRTDTKNSLINYDEYRQILCLKLKDTSAEGVWNAIEILNENEIIKEAMPDYKVEELSGSVSEVIPDDEQYDEYQWNMRKIDMPKAWALTTGSSDVKVGIIDTGISNHEDLVGNVVYGRDLLQSKEIMYGDFDYWLNNGHGTAIASIIGAVGNNGKGIAGVAWNISLVPLRVCDELSGMYSGYAIINAISFAQDQEIGIINCSFASNDSLDSMRSAITNYKGLVVCAAGNSNVNTDVVAENPGSFDNDNIINVAASTKDDVLYVNPEDATDGSNYGFVSVDLAAPGFDIRFAKRASSINHTIQSSLYDKSWGTSYAAPHVVGAAALLKSYNSDMNAYQMKYAILNNVDKIDALKGKVATGGRLNVYKALTSVMKEKVRNYIVKIDFTGNVGEIEQQIITVGFNKDLLRYCSSTGGDECRGEWITEEADKITFNGEFNGCTESEETLVTMRFNVPFDLDCVNAFTIDYYDAVMSDTTNQKPNLIVYKILLGDVNFDSKVDDADKDMIKVYSEGGVVLTKEQMLAADFNEDGKINTTDVRKIERYLAGTITSLN